MTSLQGPPLTRFGFACRISNAVPSNFIASRREVGGLAFSSEPSSAATSSTELAPILMAIRFQEPIVLMATGKGLTRPLTVGFSIRRALPPAGDFISRSASSVISSSVATGSLIRLNSPALSKASTKSLKQENAIASLLGRSALTFSRCGMRRLQKGATQLGAQPDSHAPQD